MTLIDKVLEFFKTYLNKAVLVLAIFAGIFVYFQPHINTSFNNESCINISDNWTYTNKKNEECTVDFPGTFSDYLGDTFIATRKLPEVKDGDYIFLSCVYTDFALYIEENLIYNSTFEEVDNPIFKRGMGSYWASVKLPRDCGGKTITLKISSPYKMYEEMQGSVYIGTKMEVLCTLLMRFGIENFIAIFCIILGLIMVVISIVNVIHKISSKSKFAAADVLFWAGVWILCEDTMLQYFSTNATFNIMLAYLSVQMMLRAFYIYTNLLMKSNRKFQKIENLMISFLCIYIVATFILPLNGIFVYYYSSRIFQILMMIYIAYLFVKILYCTFKKKKHVSNVIVIMLCIICVCGIIEVLIYNFAVTITVGTTIIPCLGILACLFGINELRSTRVHINMGYQAKHFEKLASYDGMTGCRNRTSYIEYMNNEGNKIKELENTVVIVCDINNMKTINDVHGHVNGDKAIMTVALILKEAFNEYGDIFRIGGDEFVGIFPNIDASTIEITVADVYKKTRSYDVEFEFPFSVSIGVANVNLRIDNSLADTFDRADKKMYTMKKAMKR